MADCWGDSDDGSGSVTPAEPAEQSEDLGSDWESYTVQVNDTVVTLPCTIADLEAAGVTLDREVYPGGLCSKCGRL